MGYGIFPFAMRDSRRSGNGFGIARRFLLPLIALSLLHACSSGEMVRAPALPTPPPAILSRIEVTACRLASRNEFVDVRFRVHGKEKFDADPAGIYLMDEATGEKYYIVSLKRIGRLAETRSPSDPASHTILIRNLNRKLKAGARVTLVVGKLRQEHVTVEK
jgi:hypothetical protein